MVKSVLPSVSTVPKWKERTFAAFISIKIAPPRQVFLYQFPVAPTLKIDQHFFLKHLVTIPTTPNQNNRNT